MPGAGEMREIKRRLKVTQSTQQITRAMQLIAASKLRRAEPLMRHAQRYREVLQQMLLLAGGRADGPAHPLLDRRQEGTPLIILISGDRGLCGAYNDQVVKKALEVSEGSRRFMAIGARGRDILARSGISPAAGDFFEANGLALLSIKRLSESITARYLEDNSISLIRLVYTNFSSALSYKPIAEDLLPVSLPPSEVTDTRMEPGEAAFIDALLPSLVEAGLYNAIMMSVASEHSARRMTMSSATDNAQDMIDKLTREYNRERQDSITGEILDIVGGAYTAGF